MRLKPEPVTEFELAECEGLVNNDFDDFGDEEWCVVIYKNRCKK